MSPGVGAVVVDLIVISLLTEPGYAASSSDWPRWADPTQSSGLASAAAIALVDTSKFDVGENAAVTLGVRPFEMWRASRRGPTARCRA